MIPRYAVGLLEKKKKGVAKLGFALLRNYMFPDRRSGMCTSRTYDDDSSVRVIREISLRIEIRSR